MQIYYFFIHIKSLINLYYEIDLTRNFIIYNKSLRWEFDSSALLLLMIPVNKSAK